MSIAEVLHAAADAIEARDHHRRERDWLPGAGGQVFVQVYEAARTRYGWPAIEHLQRVLRADLPSGQIQHWRETDWRNVVKVLREAAEIEPVGDEETVALRAKLDELHGRLAGAVGYLAIESTECLVDQVVERLERAEAEAERLRKRVELLSDTRRDPDPGANAAPL